jgi:hypothetical protein
MDQGVFLEEHKLSGDEFIEMVKNNPSDEEMIAAVRSLTNES